MRLDKLALFLVISVGSGVCYADVYQWTDEQGVTHFSDKPVNSDAKKLDIEVSPDSVKKIPAPDNSVKSTSDTDKSVKKDKTESLAKKNEAANKSREELTEELIKAREIREAKRKKRKEDYELQQIKCQEEKTKLALMNNEIKGYDEKLRNMSRSDRPKSNEYILKSDLEAQKKRLEESTQKFCD